MLLEIEADPLVARAKKAVPNDGLTWLAVAAAKSHRYGIEYIEQAPVLVIGATYGADVKKLRDAERGFIINRFNRIVGMKLKAAMAEFHLPYPMRKLRSTAIAPGYARVIWDMRSIPPSSLSQAIPDRPNHQRAWLNALVEARRRSEVRGRSFPDGAFRWLAMRLGGSTPKRYGYKHLARHAADVSDMLLVGLFNPVWTFEEALAAHARWVTELAKRDSLGKFVKTYGVGMDHEVDYVPQPNEARHIGGYEIVPLRSGEALFEEGAYMRHCVASYMKDLLSAGSCIYSIRKDGRRVATLELTSGYAPVSIKQIKGPCNAAVAKDVMRAAEAFLASASIKRPSAMDIIKGLFR